jgi:peptidoglycan/xylan/chitin deacetylase (PgdA/CDA1 family)
MKKKNLYNTLKITLTSLIAALISATIIYAATTVGENISTTGTLTAYGNTTLKNLTATGTLSVTGLTTLTNASTTQISIANTAYIGGGSGLILTDGSITDQTGLISFGDENLVTTGKIGIGTSSPYAKLSVVGETVSSYFTATSTTATSTFAGGFNAGNGGLVYDFSSGNTSMSGDLTVSGDAKLDGNVYMNYAKRPDVTLVSGFDDKTNDGWTLSGCSGATVTESDDTTDYVQGTASRKIVIDNSSNGSLTTCTLTLYNQSLDMSDKYGWFAIKVGGTDGIGGSSPNLGTGSYIRLGSGASPNSNRTEIRIEEWIPHPGGSDNSITDATEWIHVPFGTIDYCPGTTYLGGCNGTAYKSHYGSFDETNITQIQLSFQVAANKDITIWLDDMILQKAPKKAYVVLRFDDCYDGQYTYLPEILDQYNYDAVIACPTDWIGDTGKMTLTQLQNLYAKGWDIVNHGHDHENLGADDATLKDIQKIFDVYAAKKILIENGMARGARFYVYPQGGVTNIEYNTSGDGGINVKNEIDKMFSAAFNFKHASSFVWNPYQEWWQGWNIVWNTQSATDPTGSDEQAHITAVKSILDDLVSHGGIASLGFHRIYDTYADLDNTYAITNEGLDEIVDYIHSKGIEVVTYSDYYDHVLRRATKDAYAAFSSPKVIATGSNDGSGTYSYTGTGSLTEHVFVKIPIPAKMLKSHDVIRVTTAWSCNCASGTANARVKFGGTYFLNRTHVGATNEIGQWITSIVMDNATNAQIGYDLDYGYNFSVGTGSFVTASIDTAAADTSLEIAAAVTEATNTMTLEYYIVELLTPINTTLISN